ncbi:MAG: alginate lyase family protein [Candidatus Competibacteraceae bacterium]
MQKTYEIVLRRLVIVGCALLLTLSAIPPLQAAVENPGRVYFDVAERRADLATEPYATVRASCLAPSLEGLETPLEPLSGLTATEGYGTDNRAEQFSWAMMVLSSHVLGGNPEAVPLLRKQLHDWATAGALTETEPVHDAYFALKRVLLPTILAYATVRAELPDEENRIISAWLDDLVRRVDRVFDGTVDHNNHRYLADSVLMAWGALIGDAALYQQGIDRFNTALQQARADGSLPLETRRGSRAAWYMRQSLSSLVAMAEIAAQQSDALYPQAVDGATLQHLVGFFLNTVALPQYSRRYAAENYIPGPTGDYLQPDLGFLQQRGHGRHYMAWAEAYLAHDPESTAGQRLQALMARTAFPERPLLDDFIGGNATCFWGKPS